jgi:xylan 1,4-beta-xylosidase
MPILREEGIGWVFWELMLGKTEFSRGANPIQGLVYPDGTCRDAREVAAVMNTSVKAARKLFPERALPVVEEDGGHIQIVGFEAAGGLPLRKLMDTPLRDTSICRGPEGTWYLTGTVEPFYGFNEGIKLWKSRDLTNWTALGFVWKYGASPWHKKFLDAKQPLWAPEVHYLKGTFWLTYSMPGWDGTGRTSGSGLLKSMSGKPEGPYADMQPAERMGDEIDASLFEDDDGAVYFLWHSGKIARLKPDMSGLAEPYRWLKTTVSDANPNHHSGLCAGIFGKDSFDHVGYEGMFLFKHAGRYYLSCSEIFDGRYSCTVATSTNLFGPYGERYEAIPHAGHNSFFKDERGQWWSTYFGSDETAPWQERPGVLPIQFDAGGRIVPGLPSLNPARQ